jgi:NADP-dependent 3-hydroxy acid dehydrogenase YdfG
VLVTGAASGIGQAVALACAEAGAGVYGIDVDEAGLVTVAGKGVHVGLCDIRRDDQVRGAVAEAAGALGGIDALVNNAGVLRLGPMLDGDLEEWRLMVETNLLGLLQVTQASLPHLQRAGHADLVNVSSLSGRRVAHSQAAVYTATKAAVHALSDAMRAELAAHSIRTTVIAPGAVLTRLSGGISRPELRDEIHGLHESVGLDPSQVAATIVGVMATPPGVLITELGIQSVGHAERGAS